MTGPSVETVSGGGTD